MLLRNLLCGKPNTPIPGSDAQYIGHCPTCEDMELFVTRGGLKLGGVEHCYGCGTEKEVRGFSQKDMDGLILHSRGHWRKYPLLPYNWHEKTEVEKFELLRVKRKT